MCNYCEYGKSDKIIKLTKSLYFPLIKNKKIRVCEKCFDYLIKNNYGIESTIRSYEWRKVNEDIRSI